MARSRRAVHPPRVLVCLVVVSRRWKLIILSKGVTNLGEIHFEQILLLWFVWERRALNIRALCKKFFFANLWIPSLFQWTFPNELSWDTPAHKRLCGCRWLLQMGPCTSATRTVTPPSVDDQFFGRALHSLGVHGTQNCLCAVWGSHRGRGSCPCDTHVAQLVVLTQVVHVTSVLWTGTSFSVSCH